MAENTPIQWVDSTVNPTMGCAGCELWNSKRESCYAGLEHGRKGGVNTGFSPRFETITFYSGRMATAASRPDLRGLRRPDKPWLDGWPRLIFVSDMSDALSPKVPFEFLETEIIDTVLGRLGQHHCWLWLTKRPQRMAEFSAWLSSHDRPWPSNLWAGTSLTTKKTTNRVGHLLEVGDEHTVHFLSVEPQWERIDLRPWLPKLDWVIQGGESGGSIAKRFQVEWAHELREHCRSAEVPYFLKQLGFYAFRGDERIDLDDDHGGDWTEWPERLRVREVPEMVGDFNGKGERNYAAQHVVHAHD